MAKDRASLMDPSVTVEPIGSALFGCEISVPCESSPSGCGGDVRAGSKKIKKTAAISATAATRTNATLMLLPERGLSVSSVEFKGPPR